MCFAPNLHWDLYPCSDCKKSQRAVFCSAHTTIPSDRDHHSSLSALLNYQILIPSSLGFWLNSKGKPSGFEIVTGKDKSFLAIWEIRGSESPADDPDDDEKFYDVLGNDIIEHNRFL